MYEGMQEHDKTLARALVKALLDRDCLVSVNDGGEELALVKAGKRDEILDAIGNTDMENVLAHDAAGNRLGAFMLVWGNGPGELICDYTDNDFCNAIDRELEPLRDRLAG